MNSVKESSVFGTERDTATSAGIYSTGDTVPARSKWRECSSGEGSAPDANTTGIMQQRSSSEVHYITTTCIIKLLPLMFNKIHDCVFI